MTRRVMDRVFTEEALNKLMGEDYSECIGRTVMNGYIAFYHEEGLYSVEHVDCEIMCLVFAKNPYEAIDKVAMFRGDSKRCAYEITKKWNGESDDSNRDDIVKVD